MERGELAHGLGCNDGQAHDGWVHGELSNSELDLHGALVHGDMNHGVLARDELGLRDEWVHDGMGRGGLANGLDYNDVLEPRDDMEHAQRYRGEQDRA